MLKNGKIFCQILLRKPFSALISQNIHKAPSIFDCVCLVRVYIRGAYDKFSDFFRIGTFIDSTHMKL